ncbi:hypothetical protein OSSY52_14170 [Tepiditoga spiralis]|uniref:Transglycosylase SLT domain-containing protein n=1 Tax=Tepiditoga spiralis TaxID=2108365 RepID=A0A7G1G7F7_9BACT|nr:lytic transglycosylase domain-containing protein [Tepiditoga spiralis]BBE31276.1 hypothetical protein OSSY52_14170 [Tepiditoga spiralis]
MKKNFLLFIIVIIFSIVHFSFDYLTLFKSPGLSFSYSYFNNNEINFSFRYGGKYKIMNSSELLKKVWSQDRTLIGGQMKVESSNYTHAISPSKAMGLFQIKYPTGNDIYVLNLFEPYDNLKGALEYHGYLRKLFDNEKKQIAAYHEGPGTIKNNGMTKNGELYYNKVKLAQKEYKNSPVFSPLILDFNGKMYGKNIEYNLDLSLAYEKIEIYFGNSGNIEKTNNNIIFKNNGINFSIVYCPTTILSFGFGNNYGLIRLGLPWQNFIIKYLNSPEFTYYYGDQYFYFLNIKDKNIKIGVGLNVYNLKFSLNYNLSGVYGLQIGLRGAS